MKVQLQLNPGDGVDSGWVWLHGVSILPVWSTLPKLLASPCTLAHTSWALSTRAEVPPVLSALLLKLQQWEEWRVPGRAWVERKQALLWLFSAVMAM